MKIDISVVIISYHTRTQYLYSAISSVLENNFPKDRYEIIVVKDYIDKNIDINFKDYIKIINLGGTVGESLYEGIKASKGDIICFLDDDDLFYKEKLSFINNSFETDNKLVFLRNEISEINKKGYYFERPKSWGQQTLKCIEINEQSLDGVIPEDIIRNAGLMSCISIKKTPIMDKLTYIKNLTNNSDSFIFYVALASGLKIRLIPNKLTYYRISESITRSVHDFSNYYKRLNYVHASDIEMANYINLLFEGSNIENFIQKEMSSMILKSILIQNHRFGFFLFKLIHRTLIKGNINKNMLFLFFAGIIHEIYPLIFLKIYYKYHMHIMNKIFSRS